MMRRTMLVCAGVLVATAAVAQPSKMDGELEALRTYNELVEERRERLEAVEYAVPATLWGVVIAGAAISIVASFVFSMESLALHGLMTGLLAAMIGLLVFFIATTDRPYRGPDAGEPLAYEIVLRDLMSDEAPPARGTHAAGTVDRRGSGGDTGATAPAVREGGATEGSR